MDSPSPTKKAKLSREYTDSAPQGSQSFSVRRDTSPQSAPFETLPDTILRTFANTLSSLAPDSDTVMAEQHGHNVVDLPQSAGGALPVDVSANNPITTPAANGTDSFISGNKDNVISNSASEANPVTVTPSDQPAGRAVEPSAGETASQSTGGVPSLAPIQAASLGKNSVGQNEIGNGGQADVGLDDGIIRSGSVDPSVYSDTENSKGDASEVKDANRHVRTNSVKKPTSFSKVSVTKNFLAKSAATPTVAKAGEKASPAGPIATLAPKPRLVAKSGAAIANAQKARQSNQPSPGPDASTVWNKNRPVAPPPPKQFTDEELKQQYGIHLATRLQSDESGKESKWADIDDDEEDWAPETVVWMDGTKSTLAPAEEAAPPAKEVAKPDAPAAKSTEEESKPTPVNTRPAEPTGPPKTILKPGAAAAKLNTSPATTPNAEKPSLKAKSPAPTPAKSPWAALPPVDKASPIMPPVQQAPKAQTPFARQDARAYESSAPLPAREMAADTFDRWGGGGESGQRELFNSSNGRYEPAPEGRRSSMRPDTNFRKPSIMQRSERGSQSAMSPAEPSAMFQTRRESQHEGGFNRRRGSSVSHGSMPPGRRMSTTRGPEMPAGEASTGTQDLRSPHATEAPNPKFPQQSAWQQQMPPPPPQETEPEEDPYEKQQRLMKEKTTAARKRRQEDEEKEAAERKKRIEAKMAALANAGKSRAERQAEAEAAKTSTTNEQYPEPSLTQEGSAEVAQPLQAQAPVSTTVETTRPASDLKQPVPDDVALPSPIPSKPQESNLLSRKAPSADEVQRQSSLGEAVPRSGLQQQSSPYKQPVSAISSPGPASERKSQPLGRPTLGSNDAPLSPWPSRSSNVWGSSGIGNGTFGTTTNYVPQGASLPPPIGVRPPQATRISNSVYAQQSLSPLQHSQPEPRPFGPPSIDSQPDVFNSHARVSGISPGPGMGRQAHVPGPIAPPSRTQPPVQRPDPVSAWNSAATRLPQELEDAARASRAQRAESPGPPDVIRTTFKQTKPPTRLGGPRRTEKVEYSVHDEHGSRKVDSFSPDPPAAPVSETQPPGPFTSTTASPVNVKPTGELSNTVRMPDPSQNPAHGGVAVQPQAPIAPPGFGRQQPKVQGSLGYSAAPAAPIQARATSPPPPETSSHPVNSTEGGRINVKLPPQKPTVKLPPAPENSAVVAPTQQYNPALPPQRHVVVNRPMGLSGPIAQNAEWQKRFNGLFGRATVQAEAPPSPPRTPPKNQDPALAVTSSTKAVMDETPARPSYTVSLPLVLKPKTAEGFVIDESEDVVSKPTMEQMFNEELSFGSLPQIYIPINPQYAQDVDAMTPHNMLELGPSPKSLNPADTQSRPDISAVRDVFVRGTHGIFVRLPETGPAKFIKTPRPSPKQPKSEKKGKKASNNKDSSIPASPSTSTAAGSKPVKPNVATTTPPATGTTQRLPPHKRIEAQQAEAAAAAAAAAANASTTETQASEQSPPSNSSEPKKTQWAKPPKGERSSRGGYRGRGRGRGGAGAAIAA
ncbi:hypothetical protein MBLNU230_g1713t1 [Neophaeotheca triangularis]